jgi:hypothetical protein
MAVIVLNKNKDEIITIKENININSCFTSNGYRYFIEMQDGTRLGEYQHKREAEKNLYNLFRTICESKYYGYDIGYEMTE